MRVVEVVGNKYFYIFDIKDISCNLSVNDIIQLTRTAYIINPVLKSLLSEGNARMHQGIISKCYGKGLTHPFTDYENMLERLEKIATTHENEFPYIDDDEGHMASLCGIRIRVTKTDLSLAFD